MSRPKILHMLLAAVAGLAAAVAAALAMPRVGETARVNLIGPLAGTARVPAADGTLIDLDFVVRAELRQRAMFSAGSPYFETAAASVALEHPDAIPPGLDVSALNEVVASFIRDEATEHPGLWSIEAPAFPLDAPARETSSSAVRYRWPALLRDATGLAAIGLVTGGLVLWIASGASRRVHAAAPTSA